MRDRLELLNDALTKTDKGYILPQYEDKVKLLTLEVLVDIRDQISALTTILGSVEKITYRAG